MQHLLHLHLVAMKGKKNNIFTFHDKVIQREEKENLLNQNALTLWLIGLSGSGKSTIAQILEVELHEMGFVTMLLDGDNVRDGLNSNLDFTEAGRRENIRRIAEVNKLFNNCGIITINCFITPTAEVRSLAREIIGNDLFLEIFVDTPLSECEKRDVKGLYAKARQGIIPNFTGISAPFEPPASPDLILETLDKSPQESARQLLEFVLPKITRKSATL